MGKMKRAQWRVWQHSPIEGQEEELEERGEVVVVEWADQLRGELEGAKHGITTEYPLNLATVWVWCALTRTGRVTLRYPEWKASVLVGLEKVGEDEGGDVDVDPTMADLSASVSSSPSATQGPRPPTGKPSKTTD